MTVPFVTLTGEPVTRVPLLYRLDRDFQLTEPFRWVDPRDGREFDIPAHDVTKPPTDGNGTDFASVPPFLWGLIASYGKQTLPSILHDRLAWEAKVAPTGRLELRRTADEVFRVALVEAGVSQLRARVMWGSVGLERYWRHGRGLSALLIAQTVLGALAIAASIVLGILFEPWWFLLFAAPALLAIPWTRNADLVITATYLGALYAPLIIAAFLASQFERLIALIVWLLSGCPGQAPRAEPTFKWPTP